MVRSIKEGLRATLSGTKVKNIHRLNASSKEDGLTPRDLVFAYREKCLIISPEPIHARAGGWKGKLKEGDRVRIKKVNAVGGLANRFKNKVTVTGKTGHKTFEI